MSRTDRLVSIAFLVILVSLGITGIVMLYGSWQPWYFDLHRTAGFARIALVPLKAAIIFRSLRYEKKRTLSQNVILLGSFILTILTFLLIVLGLIWMWRLGPYSSLNQTLLTWHWILGVLISPAGALNAWQHWPSLQRDDLFSRRNFLSLLWLFGASIVSNRKALLLSELQATEESPRRFTGSRGFGLFTGNNFPITGESTVTLDIRQWQLVVDGAVREPRVFSYADLLTFAQQDLTETIDCHNGWYSLQVWRGVPLTSILNKPKIKENTTGVRLVSVTGLANTYSI